MSAAAIRFSSEHLYKSNTKLQAEVLTSPIKYGVVVDSDTAVSWRKMPDTPGRKVAVLGHFF